MIRLESLTRRFGQRTVVNALSFEVPTGQLCAVLGPNGAGKTTTVRMLLGLIPPTAGRAQVAGITVPGEAAERSAVRRRCGLLTETPGFYDRVSAWDNLVLFGRLYGLSDDRLRAGIERHLRFMELWSRKDDPVATFSKGMKQRLALVRAILHDPEVVFFDEPTSGLDPASARDVRALITNLRQEGRTILVCTHNLTEAEELADLVAVIRTSLLAFGAPAELTAPHASAEVLVRLEGGSDGVIAALRARPQVLEAAPHKDGLAVTLEDLRRDTPALVADLVGLGARVLEVRPRRTTLEQVYLEAVGRESP